MKLILAILFAICAFGCSSTTLNSNKVADEVFGVVDRKCIGSDTQKSFCESIQLVEIVQGTFYKVRPTETAFVVWYGSKSDLSYSVHNLGEIKRDIPMSLDIVRESGHIEKFTIDTSGLISYIFGNPNTPSTLALKALSEDALSSFSKEYPED